MLALRSLCDKHGIVLIADEIQTGFGRTGKFFASEYAGVEADLMTTAKGMAGGFPLAAVTGKAEIMDAALPGGLGGTYAGSPIGCAAALAVIETIEQENLVSAANRIGARFKAGLNVLQEQYPNVIGEIRCDRGAMMSVELVYDGDPAKPAAELTKQIVAAAYQRGLILLSCGFYSNVIRFLPALTIDDALIDEGIAIFADCLEACGS